LVEVVLSACLLLEFVGIAEGVSLLSFNLGVSHS